jgi:hypothetical protein
MLSPLLVAGMEDIPEEQKVLILYPGKDALRILKVKIQNGFR